MNAQTKIANDNMQIWDAVSKTDPANTKRVNQRGGFTAISAHSQVMEATRQFGPIGKGWGYDSGAPIFTPDGCVIVPVTVWHGDRETRFGPMYGCAQMSGNRIDTDAPKKAATDALTKLLSQLGFNADVFLGLFDDNKYIEQRQQEVEAERNPFPEGIAKNITELKAMARALWREVEACGDSAELNALVKEVPDNVKLLEQMSKLEGTHRQLWDGDGADNPGVNGLIKKKFNDFENIENNTLRAG